MRLLAPDVKVIKLKAAKLKQREAVYLCDVRNDKSDVT